MHATQKVDSQSDNGEAMSRNLLISLPLCSFLSISVLSAASELTTSTTESTETKYSVLLSECPSEKSNMYNGCGGETPGDETSLVVVERHLGMRLAWLWWRDTWG